MIISDRDLECLHSAHLFKDINYNDLPEVLEILDGSIVTLDAKETLYQEGQIIKKIGSVLSGEVVLSTYDPNGQEFLMGKLQKGYTVGANIAFSSTAKNPFFIYCTTPTRIYHFPKDNITKLPGKYAHFIYQRLLGFMANETVRHQYRIDILAQKNARLRILSYLMQIHNKKGTNDFTIPFNREQMANYLCLNRSVLSHELSLMQQEGLIEFRNNHFKLLL